MNKRIRQALALALVGWLALAGGILAQGSGPSVGWSVFSGGGGPASGDNVTLKDTLGQPVIGPSSGGGNVALGAGHWVNCTAAAAVVPVVTVTRSDANVVLTWPANSANTQYQVWISTNPYFDPNHPGRVTPILTDDPEYIDTGAAASLENHFYVVRGVNACDSVSANSGRTGEFTFGLTLGN